MLRNNVGPESNNQFDLFLFFFAAVGLLLTLVRFLVLENRRGRSLDEQTKTKTTEKHNHATQQSSTIILANLENPCPSSELTGPSQQVSDRPAKRKNWKKKRGKKDPIEKSDSFYSETNSFSFCQPSVYDPETVAQIKVYDPFNSGIQIDLMKMK